MLGAGRYLTQIMSTQLQFQESGWVMAPAPTPRVTLAYRALVLFSVIYFYRPEDFIPGLSHIPIGKIAGDAAGFVSTRPSVPVCETCLGSVDEIHLHGRVRHLRWTGTVFFICAAGLAGLPPFGTFWGNVMMDGAAHTQGYGWMTWVAAIAAAPIAANMLAPNRLPRPA